MSELLTVATPLDTPRVVYAIHLDDTLSPKLVAPCTPEGDGPSAYKRIDDDITVGIATGFWSTDLFACLDNLNALMATLCPCVALAQITHRLGMVPFNTSILFFTLLCWLELSMMAFTVLQFIDVTMLGHNISVRYFHAHRVEEPRPAINGMFVTVAVLAHATFLSCLWVLRKRIRSQFQIPGSSGDDCVAVTCCPCLSTAQMASHIKSFRPGSCSFAPVDTLPHYQ